MYTLSESTYFWWFQFVSIWYTSIALFIALNCVAWTWIFDGKLNSRMMFFFSLFAASLLLSLPLTDSRNLGKVFFSWDIGSFADKNICHSITTQSKLLSLLMISNLRIAPGRMLLWTDEGLQNWQSQPHWIHRGGEVGFSVIICHVNPLKKKFTEGVW